MDEQKREKGPDVLKKTRKSCETENSLLDPNPKFAAAFGLRSL